MAHLVTGFKGSEHIKSSDQGSFNAAFFGVGQNVMEIGNQLEGSIVNNNTVRILDGDLLMYGRHIRIEPDTYEDLTIDTGTAGKNRIDLICMTYEKNVSDGTEKAYLEVIKGSETEGTASAPDYVNGNILEGATKNQMPLYKLTINGIYLQSITQIYKVIPTYKTLAEQYAAQFEKACDTYLGALNILDTMEEVKANTQANQLAGALAVKELNANLEQWVDITSSFLLNTSGIAVYESHAFYNETLKSIKFYLRGVTTLNTANYLASVAVVSSQYRPIYSVPLSATIIDNTALMAASLDASGQIYVGTSSTSVGNTSQHIVLCGQYYFG